MATNHTEYYELNQWLSTDQVLRTDFNADNAKIDATLAGLARQVAEKADKSDLTALTASVQQLSSAIPAIAFGSYTGDGAENRTIALGYEPKAVLLFADCGATAVLDNRMEYWGGLALRDKPAVTQGEIAYLTITSNGFALSTKGDNSTSRIAVNFSNRTYYYIVFS